MEFNERVTMDGLKARNIPTFNNCEHFLVEPHPNTMQTLVINLGNDKYMTININPSEDNVDVQLHGEHRFHNFGQIKAFFDIAGDYTKAEELKKSLPKP